MAKIDSIAILIISCDLYSDLWHPILSNLKSFKNLVNIKTYLIGNEKKN
jgi:hypothetical protein